ncbi:Hypothetical predicted protein, partial [Pelobates cultripes]
LQLVQSYEDYEYFKDGDIIIGGVITITTMFDDYTTQARFEIILETASIGGYLVTNLRKRGCSSHRGEENKLLYPEYVQSIINYYHLLNFMFGIGKINLNPSILPNITLGYHLYDSCKDPRKAVKSVLQILSGPRRTVPNYYCINGRSKLAGIIGDYHSITTMPIAQILGVFGYSQ